MEGENWSYLTSTTGPLFGGKVKWRATTLNLTTA
jgi:hypothetical protein